MFDCPCVILAGGKSSRMGVDKSKLPFGGYKTLCEYQVKRLQKLFKSVHVSSKSDKFDFKADLILDDGEVFSPMVAFEKIFSHFQDEMIFILGVDIPYVSEKEIQKMHLHVKDYDIVIPKTPDFTHQLCGFYSSNLALTCKSLLAKDTHKIRELIKLSSTKYIDFEDERAFVNLNFYEEYERELK